MATQTNGISVLVPSSPTHLKQISKILVGIRKGLGLYVTFTETLQLDLLHEAQTVDKKHESYHLFHGFDDGLKLLRFFSKEDSFLGGGGVRGRSFQEIIVLVRDSSLFLLVRGSGGSSTEALLLGDGNHEEAPTSSGSHSCCSCFCCCRFVDKLSI